MPASYRIDVEAGVIFSRAAGVLTDQDLMDHQQQLVKDPEFDRGFNQLWDCRDVSEVAVSGGVLRRLAQARSFDRGAKRAVVAPDDLVYGMARMFEAFHDQAPERFVVFRSLDEAREWLGLQ